MSFYRANVSWESVDGTWNLGFFAVLDEADLAGADEDRDEEWGAEYDETSFEWVSTGHATEADA